MHEILNRNLFLVKEHVGFFKAANNFDILNPETGAIMLECREDRLGFFTKLFRFSDYRRSTPFDIQVRTPEGQQVVRVTRGVSFFLSKVTVLDENDRPIGGFKQKMFSFGGAFDVHDANGQTVCSLKGKWSGWDFRFVKDNVEFAHVTKKWAGLGRELFTSADNYVIEISDKVPPDNPIRQLIMASVLCIDMVLKE
jgi:uncharacterized protein YxjI